MLYALARMNALPYGRNRSANQRMGALSTFTHKNFPSLPRTNHRVTRVGPQQAIGAQVSTVNYQASPNLAISGMRREDRIGSLASVLECYHSDKDKVTTKTRMTSVVDKWPSREFASGLYLAVIGSTLYVFPHSCRTIPHHAYDCSPADSATSLSGGVHPSVRGSGVYDL